MKRTLRVYRRQAVLLLLLFAAGCTRLPPTAVFDDLAVAAERGDMASFLGGLTPESSATMSYLLNLPEARESSFRLQFPHAVRAVSIEHQSADGMALLRVEAQTTPPQQAQVVMRLVEGEWKLDLVATELLWNRDWAKSGGAARPLPAWLEEPMPRLDKEEPIR
jgi:hypothetical protein